MKQLAWINLHARGLGNDPVEARQKVVERLQRAVADLSAGHLPMDPGVRTAADDPGGGGGPCAPEYIKIEVNVTASGLPEAQSNDDD